jgi:prophage regulatory protein
MVLSLPTLHHIAAHWEMTTVRILSFEDLRSEKGIPYSKVHLWRLERDAKFPKRVPLGQSRHGWLESEIEDWLLERMAARNVKAA